MKEEATKRRFRSSAWLTDAGHTGFGTRSYLGNSGRPRDQYDGRPVVGICNTWSELTPCNSHFRTLAKHVHDGVLEAGGFPLEFPVMSLGETLMLPTTMLHRNLVSMDVEESLRSNPLDGVVLLMGCDKTTPALLMGAASVDLPTIGVSGGPMLNGNRHGERFGVADVWKLYDEVRAGRAPLTDMAEAEPCLARSHGHCNIMGTASSMACMVETLGIGLPGNAAIPAVDANRNLLARLAGRRAVEMIREGLTLSKLLTRAAFENAIRVNSAIGGSSNVVIHLTALARRVGIPLHLADWDQLGTSVPLLVNLQPSGTHLMEEFYYAGGLPAVLREMGANGLLNNDAMTANGRTLWENCRDAPCYNPDVIRTLDKPLKTNSGMTVLKGNLCPDGAIIKSSAATPELLRHTGRAVVFENVEDLHARVEDPDLPIDRTSVMVLRNCGPKGFPGMPELGNLPIPSKLLKEGVSDMVRISDSRMSGTAFGTVVLHISPEAAIGGPLALVQDGDLIELDANIGLLHLHVSDSELALRRAAWRPAAQVATRGYTRMYVEHVNQAHEGADLDFLVGCSGGAVLHGPATHAKPTGNPVDKDDA